MSALKVALEKAGYSKHEMRAFGWAKEFIEAGGSREQWLAAFDRASDKCGGRGQYDFAERQLIGATPPQPAANGKDRTVDAPKRLEFVAAPVRSINAAVIVAKQLAAHVLDRHYTTDGRRWSDVKAYELDGMDRDGKMARAIRAKLGTLSNSQRRMKIADLLSAKLAQEAVKEANNAA